MQALIQHLQQKTGQSLNNHRLTTVSGGDINQAYQLKSADLCWFIKLNQADRAAMFAAEAAGLQELATNSTLRLPQVIDHGQFQQHAYLLLEFIELKPLHNRGARLLGQQLAKMHHRPQNAFGWPIDNTIGATPQTNSRSQDWVEFWRQQRLGKQLQLAASRAYTSNLQDRGETLLEKMSAFFDNYRPHPALLHGDLWSGNAAMDHQGHAVIFDPACYYGDRETDIAMTELFGGFSKDFYAAYQDEYPLDTDYKVRKDLYNLYHILNHLNLFGRSYLNQALNTIDQLLAELS